MTRLGTPSTAGIDLDRGRPDVLWPLEPPTGFEPV